jgi:predicted DNA-binding transcriptional regulator AlpA
MQSQFGPCLYVSQAQLISVMGISRSTLRRMVRDGLFPMPVPFRGSMRYSVPEVMRTLAELHAARKGSL